MKTDGTKADEEATLHIENDGKNAIFAPKLS
jgi:hypothetical protein